MKCRLTSIDDLSRDPFGLCSSSLPLDRNLSVESGSSLTHWFVKRVVKVEPGSAICRNMEMRPLTHFFIFILDCLDFHS